jgi:rRNA maturation endonuclease Nob1
MLLVAVRSPGCWTTSRNITHPEEKVSVLLKECTEICITSNFVLQNVNETINIGMSSKIDGCNL